MEIIRSFRRVDFETSQQGALTKVEIETVQMWTMDDKKYGIIRTREREFHNPPRKLGDCGRENLSSKLLGINKIHSVGRLRLAHRTVRIHNTPRKLGDYAMAGPYKEAARRLLEIAQAQQGFFTTKQAIRAGFAEKVHAYHVNTGNWIREHRGIYRLADFPTPERPDLMLWYLWSQNRREIPEGVYSHNTALSLHELSDLMPSKLHMTVPKDFRRSSAIPEILVLHRMHLESSDAQEIHGVRVTCPLRTIVDLLRSGNVDRSQLKLAVDEAIRRGLVVRREIDRLPHDKLQRSLQDLAGQPA